MNNIASAKTIRNDLANNTATIRPTPGIYRWWFKVSTAKNIIKVLNNRYDISQLLHKNIEGADYVAMYFGEAGGKGLLRRIGDHVSQHHTKALADNGGLSTLRQTLCAVGGYDMSDPAGETYVNKVIDECWWEWEYTQNAQAAKEMETTELSTNCYPLNIKENKLADDVATNILRRLRKDHKK